MPCPPLKFKMPTAARCGDPMFFAPPRLQRAIISLPSADFVNPNSESAPRRPRPGSLHRQRHMAMVTAGPARSPPKALEKAAAEFFWCHWGAANERANKSAKPCPQNRFSAPTMSWSRGEEAQLFPSRLNIVLPPSIACDPTCRSMGFPPLPSNENAHSPKRSRRFSNRQIDHLQNRPRIFCTTDIELFRPASNENLAPSNAEGVVLHPPFALPSS